MADLKKQARAAVAGLMMAGMASGVAFGYPDVKEKPKGDLGAVLEKVPPEVREKLKAEFEKIRAEAEKVRAEAMEAQKQARARIENLEREAKTQVERVQRDAKEQVERVHNEVRRQMEAMQRDRNAARVVEGQKLAEVKEGEGRQRQEIRREMRVEVRKEGDGEPMVQIFENGKPVDPATVDLRGRLNPMVSSPEKDLAKLPPEKREAIEKARKEFKEAEARFKAAAEKLAKTDGGNQPKVMVFTDVTSGTAVLQGQPHIEVRAIPLGDRLPGTPLPLGAVIVGDRLPRPPVQPFGPGHPELKKLREEEYEEEEDDDDDEKEAKQKPKKQKKG